MTATWTLTEIQEEAFSMAFDLYRPKGKVVNGELSARGVELVAEAVPGRLATKSEASDLTPFGRANRDQMDTTDTLRLPDVFVDDVPLQIGDGWFAQVMTGAGTEVGGWMAIGGEGVNRVHFADTRVYLVKKNIKPPKVIAP